MDVAVVVVLLGLWAAILLPGLVRASRQGSPSTSVSRFHGSLALLERTSCAGSSSIERHAAPREPTPSRVELRRRACARRRTVVGALLGGLLGSLAAVPLLGAVALTAAALFAGTVGAYVAAWRRLVAQRTLARRVAHLPRHSAASAARSVGQADAWGAVRADDGTPWAAVAGEDPRWR